MSPVSSVSPYNIRRRYAIRRLHILVCLLLSAVAWAIDCGHPNARQFADAAACARLSEEVYKPNGGDPPPGWKVLESNEDSNWSGFQYAVYQNREGDVVLAFRGSEKPWQSPVDWVNNVANGLGPLVSDVLCPQYDEAMHKALELKLKYGDKLTLTGHSLGGGLASYAAYGLDLPAYTFNPAAVGWDRLLNENLRSSGGARGDRVTNFVREWDPVNAADYVDLASKVGQTVKLNGKDDYPIFGPLDAHSIEMMSDYMDQYIDCFKKKPPAGGGSSGGGGATGGGGTPNGGTGTPPGTGLPSPTDDGGGTSGGKAPQLDPLR